MTNDMINGLLEFSGSLFILNHCRVLFGHKQVRGVSILATAFFFVWGVWNLHYYPSLGQWWSFAGGVCIMVANLLWIGMMVWYIEREKAAGRSGA